LRFVPTVFVEAFFCCYGVVKVPREHLESLYHQLASWVWLVGYLIAQVCSVSQFEFDLSVRASSLPVDFAHLRMTGRRHFTHPVALVEWTGKRCLEKPEMRFLRAISRAENSSYFAAKEFSERLEDSLVQEVVSVNLIFLESLHLLLDGDVEGQLLVFVL